MQPKEKQPSTAIFLVINGLIFIIFLIERTLNIQICLGLLYNIMIQKCYFLELVALSPEFNTKILYKNRRKDYQRDSRTLSESFILVSFVAWLITHCTGKNYNYCIKSSTFYRQDKVFYKVHSLIQNLSIGDQQVNLNYPQGNLIQDSIYVNNLLKTCRYKVLLKIRLSKQLLCELNC